MGMRGPRSAGFTLVELMVTIAVLAIVLAAAAPSFADFFDRYRLRGAVDDVVSLITNARAASVKADRDVIISLGGAGTSAWCLGANAALEPSGGDPTPDAEECDCTDASQCLVGGDRLAIDVGQEGKVSVDSLDPFTFGGKLGLKIPMAPPSIATFTSPRGKYDLRVTVNALGQATVCIPTGKPVITGVTSC